MDVKKETSNIPPYFKYKESKKYTEDFTENGKWQWVELRDYELKHQMSGLMDYMYEKEIDNLDWGAPNIQV